MLNKTLVFPVALEPRFKVVGTDLKIRFDGAKIPHRVWPREARGGRKSKFGPNIFVRLLVSCPRM